MLRCHFHIKEEAQQLALVYDTVGAFKVKQDSLSIDIDINSSNIKGLSVKMGGGRKNLKRAKEEGIVTLQDGQTIMQVLSLRGSNLIEVMDAHGEKSLALFPAKFQKSMWMKRGSFVVVDESAKEKALESGCKVACIVSQVLFYEQVRALKKSPEWPEIFKSGMNDSNERTTSQQKIKMDKSDDDDGLPPLEANTNRMRPVELQADKDSESSSDIDT